MATSCSILLQDENTVRATLREKYIWIEGYICLPDICMLLLFFLHAKVLRLEKPLYYSGLHDLTELTKLHVALVS